ncbi:MAG: hypothetical protein N3D11_02020 [Candidatus Sumerlaeia bacterium]|nr:hypothetical protein [Candidatus Sumerlaeia bacterium]
MDYPRRGSVGGNTSTEGQAVIPHGRCRGRLVSGRARAFRNFKHLGLVMN